MQGNTDRCHSLLTKKTDKTQLHLGDSLIKNSAFEKLLGVIDNKLCFDQHIKIETGLSDFLKWLLLLWKWNLRNWSHEQYTIGTIEIVPLHHLLFNLSMENISLSECDLEEFLEICFRALDRFAPCKKDFSEKITSFLWIEILKKHKFTKTELTPVILLILNSETGVCLFWKKLIWKEKNVGDNKQFWRTAQPLLSYKI